MTTDDGCFFASLDGELIVEEAANMDAKAAADPWLPWLASPHRALALELCRAFAEVGEALLPRWLATALTRSITLFAKSVNSALAVRDPQRNRWPMWLELTLLLMAASVLVFCVRKTADQLKHHGLVVAVWSLMAVAMSGIALWGYLLIAK